MSSTPKRGLGPLPGGKGGRGPDAAIDSKATGAAASGPLAGVRVVVTRPALQAEDLCAAFAERGALVERLPLIEVVPPDDPAPLRQAVADLPRYRWVAFTSANAVAPLGDPLAEAGRTWPEGVRVAAVGQATSEALRDRGIEPALVATGGGQVLAEKLAELDADLPNSPVLLPQPPDARPELAAGLRRAGAQVETVIAYDKRLPIDALERARALFPPTSTLGWVTFTSPRIAQDFADLIGEVAGPEGGWPHRRLSLLAASIGPTTTAALAELGVEPSAEAATPSDENLADAVAKVVASSAKHRS